MRKGKKSYFYKFLLNFMITLVIPLMSIVFVYLKAEQTVRNQILNSNHTNLNQFFSMANMITQEMYDICVSVTNSQECINYSYYYNYSSKKAAYQTVMVKETLNNFKRDRYYDIFAYFPTERRVISSTNGSMKANYYYDTYYSEKVTEVRREFNDILECETKRPTFFVLNHGSSDSYLCVAMRQPNYKEAELSYVAAVVLDKGIINQMIETDNMTGGIIMMFDGDGKVLLSNDADSTEWHLDKNTELDRFQKVEMNGKSYMMMVKKASVVDGYYASAIPMDYFWKQLYTMRIICISSMIICIAASILIAVRSTLRTYRPVMNVVARLAEQAENNYDGMEHTEFEYITAFFEQQKEEGRTLRKELHTTEKLRRDKRLMALMKGSDIGKEVETAFGNDGIELCSECFMVALISIETKLETELASFIVCNVFEELCNRKHKGYALNDDGSGYLLFINPQEENDEEEIMELLREGKEFLRLHCHIGMSIALSDMHKGTEEIPIAYKEAEKAFSYRYLLGDGIIIKHEKIANRKLSYPASSESRLSRMITQYVKGQEHRKTTALFVTEVMDMYEINEDASMETIECFKYEIANIVNRAMISVGYSAEEGERSANALLARPDIGQFREELVRLLMLLCQKEHENEQQNDACKFARQYIDEHFSDPELSVAAVGEQMKLSGAYLSRMYKEKYGISILAYITQVRIDNAKTALLKTDKSVQEIAEENGFLSSNVFIKSFKKQEGVTPGAYRELGTGRKANSGNEV